MLLSISKMICFNFLYYQGSLRLLYDLKTCTIFENGWRGLDFSGENKILLKHTIKKRYQVQNNQITCNNNNNGGHI